MRGRFEGLLGIDARSLALFRVGLGALLVLDILFRFRDIRAFYADDGILPRAFWLQTLSDPWRISIYFIAGRWEIVAVLFVAALAAAVAFTVGYRTRLVTAVCWFHLMSLHTRNPLVLQGGDVLMRMLFFWSMFLPLEGRFSLDRVLGRIRKEIPSRILSVGGIALMGQVLLLYWCTALLKTGADWRRTGNALYYSLSLDQFAMAPAGMFLSFPSALTFVTHFVFWFEASGPFLLIWPFFIGPVRTAGVFLFILFHAAIGAGVALGLFPFIDIVSVLPFLPGWFWDKVRKNVA